MAMSSRNRGSILAETVLVMPLLLLLIFGVIQFALIWTAKQMTAYAAFCATRAIMVVPPSEQENAAKAAANVALSWMCLAYDPKNYNDKGVVIPGWGKVSRYSRGSNNDPDPEYDNLRVITEVTSTGVEEPDAAVKVTFRYPLLIPGMAINRIVGNSENLTADDMKVDMRNDTPNFYDQWKKAVGNPALIDGWPYITLTETCVLPMPYSTVNFPKGGFKGTSLSGGGS
jgi:hypothetical protein